jgi:hypothetical protein
VLLVPPPVAPDPADPDTVAWAADRLALAVVAGGTADALIATLQERGVQVDRRPGRGPATLAWAVPSPD